jgi:hypothetical protein
LIAETQRQNLSVTVSYAPNSLEGGMQRQGGMDLRRGKGGEVLASGPPSKAHARLWDGVPEASVPESGFERTSSHTKCF